MIKKRFISMLVLLCLTVSGAWGTVTPLITIENIGDNKSFKSGSKTFDDKVTVTFSGAVYNQNSYHGWYWSSADERTLTVTAAEGYTITRVKFYNYSGSAFDETSPFQAILVNEGNGNITKVNGTSIHKMGYGVTKIEVYGYAGTLVAATGVTLEPTSATLTVGEWVTLTATVLPDNATYKSVNWSSSDEAVAAVSNEGVVYAVGAGEATITVTTDDGAFTATCTVTVAEPTYKVSVKEGTEDATSWQGKAGTGGYQALPLTGLEAGTAFSVKYNGTKKVKSVKAVKKAAAAAAAYRMAAAATNADKGKLICTDGHIHAYGEDAECTKARVAKIIYLGLDTSGYATYSHGLALALTDEVNMAWEDAIAACSAKNTSTPVTDATWLLASLEQWQTMISGSKTYTALRDGFSSVGGTNMQSDSYWTSSHSDNQSANIYRFSAGTWGRGNKTATSFRVRACLAF